MRQEERTEATRAKLLEVGRELFTERGFAGVPAEELVARAGLTRGALYHHFGGKEGLFLALNEALQREVAERIMAAAVTAPDPFAALEAGCGAFLAACLQPAVQRIMLLDGPAVLSWERWREIDARHGFGLLKAGLRQAVAAGAITVESVDAVAHLLVGALNEAALWIARSPEPERAQEEAVAAIGQLLGGLRPRGGEAEWGGDWVSGG